MPNRNYKTDLSVIIPTYNEAENIEILIEKLRDVLKEFRFEIIVVDDNSPDLTWKKVQDIADASDNVRIIRRFKEKGLSSAVMTGMSTAKGRVFVVMDADLQHDERIIPDLYKAIINDGFDMSVGSRGAEGGSYGDWSVMRLFISRVAATMAKIMLPIGISDPMSGFFAVSRELYFKTAEVINPRGFKILLEFIGRAGNIKIKEIGYTFKTRIHGETKMSTSVIRNYLIALFDLRFGKLISPVFLMYSIVGTTGVFVNLLGFKLGEILGFPHITTGLSSHFDPLYTAAPFGYQLAIISNYLMNNYFTFYENRHKAWALLKGFFVFELISLFGLVVHTGTFQLLQANGAFYGVVSEAIRPFLNNAIAILVALVSNYYLNLNFTWGKKN